MTKGFFILLVDDDSTNFPRMTQGLLDLGAEIVTSPNGRAALDVIASLDGPQGFPGIVITDLKMPEMDGLELLTRALKSDNELPIVIVSAFGEVATAVEAMKAGAYDFIERPLDTEALAAKARRALDKRKLVLDNRRLKTELANRTGLATRLIGNSPSMQALRDEIANVGATDATVLIHGETGTGKEVVARALHDCSSRSKARFVAINCGALSENLIDSELFGHEAGAFTDAKQRRIGLVEYAKGGTLFLDEIESMPVSLQVKLLRMLQERVISRLGSNEEIKVDIRLVAATKADLLDAAKRREFREDLYFRLGVAELHIPSLNNRREDVPLLFAHFIQEFCNLHLRPAPAMTGDDVEKLMAHHWRGNVRELRNVAERFVLGVGGAAGGVAGALAGGDRRPKTLPEQMDAIESALIERVLFECGGNIQVATDLLGVPRRTLNEKMRKFGLERKDFRQT